MIPYEPRFCPIDKFKTPLKKCLHSVIKEWLRFDGGKVDRIFWLICQVEGTVGDYRSVMTAPLSGATRAGNDVPERTAIASSSSPASSVVSNPPNIPNVVEYHLKVKPGQTQGTCRADNYTVSTDSSTYKRCLSLPLFLV